MTRLLIKMSRARFVLLGGVVLFGCAGQTGDLSDAAANGTGGSSGGSPGSGGTSGLGGQPGTGGASGAGGANTGGTPGAAGTHGTGGVIGTGGAGGKPGTGGASAGGISGTGGTHSGGAPGTGGTAGTAGSDGAGGLHTGGTTGTGGTSTGGGGAMAQIFSPCRFHFGALDGQSSATLQQVDTFTSGWMGQQDTFDMTYVCTETNAGGKVAGKVRVLVAYVAAFYAKRHFGRCDCNVTTCGANNDLCHAGAADIQQNLTNIVNVYKSYAQGFASCYGTTKQFRTFARS